MTPRMEADCNVGARQIAGLGDAGLVGHNNGRFTNTVSLPPHNAFFNLRRLVYRPMASTADIAGAFTLAPMPLGITFERAKTVILERDGRIHAGEPGRVLAASFYIELVVQTFLGKITLFLGDPIVESTMRLNNKFRHIGSP